MAAINTGLGGPQGVGEGSFRGSALTSGNYDDGAIKVDIRSVFGPDGIDWFGTSHQAIHINTNGLISFGAPQTSYTPTAISGLSQPAIAPFWSDVNITTGSATGTNNIYWDLDPVNGNVTVTWLGVKPYSGATASNTNTFQVVLHHSGSGNFEIEVIYQQIKWTNGGYGVAQTGFTDGGTNDVVFAGSGQAQALLNFPNAVLSPGDPVGTWSQNYWNGTAVCFAAGTRIATPAGPRPVESLSAGDPVLTLDEVAQPIRWAGGWSSELQGAALPVEIAAGALGNARDLRLSGQHLLMLDGWECELMFGATEVLVAAKELVGLPGIRQETSPVRLGYHHLLLDRHQILFAEGLPAESLHPGPMAEEALPVAELRRMRAAIPPLELARMARQPAARRVLRGVEARALRAAILAVPGAALGGRLAVAA